MGMTREEASDCISRKRAIERLKLNLPISQGADNSRDRHRYMQALADLQAIKELPSVTPQKSEWEHDHEMLRAYSDGAKDTLDKIRGEIEAMSGDIETISDVLAIIDKYKAENEG